MEKVIAEAGSRQSLGRGTDPADWRGQKRRLIFWRSTPHISAIYVPYFGDLRNYSALCARSFFFAAASSISRMAEKPGVLAIPLYAIPPARVPVHDPVAGD
jgi:hypothetical protein